MSSKLKALIAELVKIHEKLEGKVGAAFTSSGGTASGAETTSYPYCKLCSYMALIIQGRAYP
ncbi:MAG: hypothetical protein QXM52_06455 [Candidatus Bathyarchaeia archaeon]